jgi:hypothetical protein
MLRRLLLIVFGLGISAVAVLLSAGPAHALAPPALPVPSSPPVPVVLPAPPMLPPVVPVVTRVVRSVEGRLPVTPVPSAVAKPATSRHRNPPAAAPARPAAATLTTHGVDAVGPRNRPAPQPEQTRTPRHDARAAISQRRLLHLPDGRAGIGDDSLVAPAPTPLQLGAPFALPSSSTSAMTPWSTRLGATTAPRTRSGFLAGSDCPG